MRIAIVSSYPPLKCGIGYYAKALVSELRRLADVVVIGHEGSSADVVVEGLKYKVHHGYAEPLLRVIEDVDPDVVHIQHEYGIWGYVEEFINLLKGIAKSRPVVVTMHSVDHSLKGDDVVKYNLAIGKEVSAIVVHSVLQEMELATQGVDQRKIRIIPHGSDPPVDLDPKAVRVKLGFPEDVLLYGSIGYIRPDKNLRDLLLAHKIIEKKLDAKLVVIGIPQREKYWAYYENEIKPLIASLSKVIHRLEEIPEKSLIEYISALDIVVFPYAGPALRKRIAVSGALHKAMSASRPAVVSRESKFFEYFMMFPELSYPAGCPEELAKAVLRLAEDQDFYSHVKKAVREYAERTSWRRVAEAHFALYKEVVE